MTKIRIFLAVLSLIGLAASARAAVPTQFIAKTYSEALGRLPDQGGWSGVVSYYQANGCNRALLKTWGRTVYLSAEYSGLGYDNAARVLTVYRGILNREPDPGGFNTYHNLLNGGTSFEAVVDAFFDSAEFNGLVGSICAGGSYSFGGSPVIDLPVSGSGFAGGTGAQLQAVLNSTPPGGTVFLAQKAVVRLSSMLTIPAGVTLATTGFPHHNVYANMGRLVRTAHTGMTAVQLLPGAKLRNVWVDGQRGVLGFNLNSINVQLFGGSGTEVSNCLISNTAGWSSLQAFGSFEGFPCGSNTITGNRITVFSSSHTGGTWADALSIACENTLIENNEMVDATDVAIVVFRASPAVQRSIVRNNRILSAGNSAYGAIGVDPLHSLGQTHDFTGTSIDNNLFWSGPNTHFDIGLAVGTRAWFGTASDVGVGASFTNNHTGSQTARVDCGICISGMHNTFVQSNVLSSSLTNSSNCPTVNVGASVSAGHASGSFQPYTDVLIQGCIGH